MTGGGSDHVKFEATSGESLFATRVGTDNVTVKPIAPPLDVDPALDASYISAVSSCSALLVY